MADYIYEISLCIWIIMLVGYFYAIQALVKAITDTEKDDDS